jgi:hypothetical protein
MSAYADGDQKLPVGYPDSKEDQQQRSEAMTMYQQFRNIDLEGITESIEWKTDPATRAWLKEDDDHREHDGPGFESHVIRKNYRYTLKLRDGDGTITYYKIKDGNCTVSNAETTGDAIVRKARVYISIEHGNYGYDTVVRLEVYGPESGSETISVNEVLNGRFDLVTGWSGLY